MANVNDAVLIKSIEDIEIGHIIGSGHYNDVVELIDLRRDDENKDQAVNTGCHQKNIPTFSFTKNSASKYVVKMLRCDLSNSTRNDGALALATEAKLLEKLSHPHIIPMRYLGNNMGDAEFFIIIERIDIDLAQQIRLWKGEEARLGLSKSASKFVKGKKLEASLYDRIAIAYQVASALFYLHERKIMFRDLKPQNIGLDRDNNAKIFDFGLSKELCDEIKVKKDAVYDKYIATQGAGTPRYMAPEVYDSTTYGLPVDIYSCSMVLWELMSLEESFEEMSCILDMTSQVYEKKRRPLINRHWPKEIKRLLQNGWHHDPSKRPEAMEFCDELQICMRRRVLEKSLMG